MSEKKSTYIPDKYKKYWDKLEKKAKSDDRLSLSYLVNEAVKKYVEEEVK